MGLCVGVPALLVFLIFAGAVGYDVMRPPPAIINKPLPLESGKNSPSPSNHSKNRSKADTESTSGSQIAIFRSNLRHQASLEFEKMDAALTSFSLVEPKDMFDIAWLFGPGKPALPAFLKNQRELRDQYNKIEKDLHEFARLELWRDYVAGAQRLAAIEAEYRAFMERLENLKPPVNWYYLDHCRKLDKFMSWRIFCCALNDRWLEAAEYLQVTSAKIVMRQPQIPSDRRRKISADFWEAEMQFLRVAENGGRGALARRSAQRNWEALKRSFLSIGPEFEMPHHEPGD